MFTLAGAAGLPTYLRTTPSVRGRQGIYGGECEPSPPTWSITTLPSTSSSSSSQRTTPFCTWASASREEGGRILNSVCSRIPRPRARGLAGDVSGQQETELCRVGDHPGPHLFRLEKKGATLTMAVCVGFEGEYVPTFSKTIPDLKAVGPFLTKSNARIFFAGHGWFEAVRLTVDGKPADPGVVAGGGAPVAATTRPVAEPPLFSLAGRSGLPAYLRANSRVTADLKGLRGGEVRTAMADLINKNFTFDVLYSMPGKERTRCLLSASARTAATAAARSAPRSRALTSTGGWP